MMEVVLALRFRTTQPLPQLRRPAVTIGKDQRT
jgi:hypothetical protein